ncbi:MAG: alpha/beta hydrolase-fold protein [Fimbriimonadaceae bacterium]
MIASLASLLIFQSGWKSPVVNIESPFHIESYIQDLGDKDQDLFVRGDLFTFVVKSKEQPGLFCGFDIKTTRWKDSDYWVAQFRLPQSDQVFFRWMILDSTGRRAAERHVYRAPKAPPLPEATEDIDQKIKTVDLPWPAGDEKRTVRIYVPAKQEEAMPTIYLADGGGNSSYVAAADALIQAGKIRPVIIVAVDNGGYRGKPGEYKMEEDYRAKEYLKILEDERYDQHLDFFTGTVRRWVEENYPVSLQRRNRAVMGYSNGGAFALTASLDRPDAFGKIWAYSIAAHEGDFIPRGFSRRDFSQYSVCSGVLETFSEGTARAAMTLKESGAHVSERSFNSGHDSLMWQIAFVRDLVDNFPPRK